MAVKQKRFQRDLTVPLERQESKKGFAGPDLDGADLHDRLVLVERFSRKPGINADVQDAAEATRMIANRDFEVTGVNAVSADSSFDAEGGVKLTTAGADGDEMIVHPHLDANQSQWEQTTWGTDQETRWEAFLRIGANITNAIIWAGLKLTSTEVEGTDADAAWFRYEDDVNGGKLQAIVSIGGTDTVKDLGITIAVGEKRHLAIEIDVDRKAHFFVDGVEEFVSDALTDAIDLKPYIGVAADGAAAAKVLTVRWTKISRLYA